MIHRIEIVPKGAADPVGQAAANEIRLLGIQAVQAVSAGRVFLIEGELDRPEVERIAAELLADPVVEEFHIGPTRLPHGNGRLLVEVFPLPGVMDPVALSTRQAIAQMGLNARSVRTGRVYQISSAVALSGAQVRTIIARVLANECIEQATVGSVGAAPPPQAPEHEFRLVHVPVRELDDDALARLSADGHLFLNLAEMRAIQARYRRLGREPTDVELETLAQTWSEHCVHKTLKSAIDFVGPDGTRRRYENLLADTIVAATRKLNRPWCISVFKDNAGVIEFDDRHAVCFKVETHNHPSAIEPYGGAATGIGGCIRDPLGTGLGAKPIANTDVFCFAPPDWPAEKLPKGVLHPRRVMRGVVAGVRDYGNRMGIPTVNGAIFFDDRYLGNPLVFCGDVALMDRDKCFKNPATGDAIVLVGGRTGRDGIHGATFSSGELTHAHEDEFSHAVQIGNAITEKKMADVLAQARDRRLYSAITDCGAGGLSSAVGEMGEHLGAVVNLETVPLKYAGLTYTEIWISEAQERMVLAVPPENVDELLRLFAAEDVEATVIGRFTDDNILRLFYRGQPVGELDMEFLHHGLPRYTRKAKWSGRQVTSDECRVTSKGARSDSTLDTRRSTLDFSACLLRLLAHWNIASKEWVIRQYDHEVQGGSVVKPLVGLANDGPGDGAVLTPVLGSTRGIALACGLSARLGDLDPYQMALHAIDECVRNLVCLGCDFDRIAILDNFCWGNCDKPGREGSLGSLVLAAQACHDGAIAYGTPFISGKDSLNNEFVAEDGQVIAIPPTLLISGIGIVPDVRRCVTMDAKRAGNRLVAVGVTRDTLAGSHYELVAGNGRLRDADYGTGSPNSVPQVDLVLGPRIARAVAGAIAAGLVRSAHDPSEGGLAVALAEMCFAGGLGLSADLSDPAGDAGLPPAAALFGESPSRYLLEVEPDKLAALEKALADIPHRAVGQFTNTGRLEVSFAGRPAIYADIADLKRAWQGPLAWK